MRFIYKIWSGYDGFVPSQVESRTLPGELLRLSWDRYIDQVDKADEVWLFFHGPHRFANGVYVKGSVHSVDLVRGTVDLKVRTSSATLPLTVNETAEQIANLVRLRGIQAFLVPQEWQPVPECTALTTGTTCRRRQCEWCPVWEDGFPRAVEYRPPERVGREVSRYVAGYWVIPRRCFLRKSSISTGIRKTSELFYGFKTGQKSLAYPLSLALYFALTEDPAFDCDSIVPVPLSPEKRARGEFDRTLALARELSKFLGCRVSRSLGLSNPISKRVFLNKGGTVVQFEKAYRKELVLKADPGGRVLLVDDVGTRGSTLKTCALKISEGFDPEITAVTAGLMITKWAVRNSGEILT